MIQKHTDQALEEYRRALTLAEKFGIKDEDPLTGIRTKVKELEQAK